MVSRRIQNIFYSILIAAAVVVIAGISLYFLSKGGFRQYHHPDYAVSLKYPLEWEYIENQNGAIAIFYSPKETSLDIFQESLNIVVQDIGARRYSLEEYSGIAIKQMKVVFGEAFELLESKPATLAGMQGHEIIFIGRGPEVDLKYRILWALKGKQAFQVTYTSLLTKYDYYIDTIDKMIKSIRVK